MIQAVDATPTDELIDEAKLEQKLYLKGQRLSYSNGQFQIMPKTPKLLKRECRKGIPEDFREKVWMQLGALTNGEACAMPNPEATYNAALKEVFGESMGRKGELFPSDFGGVSSINDHCLSEQGVSAFKRIRLVLQQLYALGYCPILLDLIPTLLIYFTEAQVYVFITMILKGQRKHANNSSSLLMRRIQTNYSLDIALVRAFKNVMSWRYPKIKETMVQLEAYDDKYFLLLFTRIFTGFLPLPVVLRILDAYLLEGPKVFCRVAMALFKLCRKDLVQSTRSGKGFWSHFRQVVNSENFSYDDLLRYSFRWTYSILFKRRKLTRFYEEEKKDLDLLEKAATFGQSHPLQIEGSEHVRLIDPNRDYFFRSWLPATLQTRKLRQIYSAEVQGRGLDTLYTYCRNVKKDAPVLLLIEVLNNGAVIGAFCSHSLIRHKSFFGSTQTFVFRMNPYPQRFKSPLCADDDTDVISPTSNRGSDVSILTPSPSPRLPRNSRFSRNSRASRSSLGSLAGDDYDEAPGNFILCMENFLSVGIDRGSSAAALRINFDLTAGSTEESDVFLNPPLAEVNEDGLTEFSIGGVEVYEFIHK